MISNYLGLISSFLSNRPRMLMDEIKNKSKDLGVTLPKPLVEFYEFLGGNDEVLSSYYEFIRIEDISFYRNALLFCYGHQRESLIGITLDDMNNNDDPPVSKTFKGYDKWYFESNTASSFLVNMACWQVVNALPGVSRLLIEEKTLREKINTYLNPIRQDKSIFLGYDLLSYINQEKNILACYLRESEEFYVASTDDSFLDAFEKETGFELDWL